MPRARSAARLVAQLGPDEFLVAGADLRLRFALADAGGGENMQILSVEEGTFEGGNWVMRRRWNGDQIDYGLNLTEPFLSQGPPRHLPLTGAAP